MFNCERCNSKMIWQNDYDAEDYELDADGIVTVYYCPNCDIIHEYLLLDDEVILLGSFSLEDEDEGDE